MNDTDQASFPNPNISGGVNTNPNSLVYGSNMSEEDKYFIEQRNIILQDVNSTMDSILNGLNELNISLESSIAVGKEFEVVTKLWRNFYNGTDPLPEEQDSERDDADVDMTNS